ncbi:MAG: hypothetical protein CSA21_05800 [Deltaproteobacteria bacterium]|nr:MAG: hypothetical protein CSA21_05800 [Deltaproteobacteria bacterium]
MLHAFAKKEWLKLRRAWWIGLSLNLIGLIYLFFHLNHLFTLEHAETIWYRAFVIATPHYGSMKYLMVFTGLLLAAAQFVPEMLGHRFRLSLHLPVPPDRIVLLAVFMGLGTVVALIGVDALGLGLILSRFYPWEAVISGLWTAFPWLFAGVTVYLGTALVLLEPGFTRKLVCCVLALGVTSLFFQGVTYEEMNQALVAPVVLTLLFIPAILLPAYRYRNGRYS